MQNYFDLFAINTQFDVDLSKLELAYEKKIAEFHPDKFATQSEHNKSIAIQNTALVNTAYNTLKSPLTRAVYLLELNGIQAFDEKDTRMAADFLTRQIELREQLESIQSEQNTLALDDFLETVQQHIQHNTAQIKQSFASHDLHTVKNLVRELKFYTQLNDQANRLMDEWL